MTEDNTLLTAFQIEVAKVFFGLPASEGFLLAGGGALLAQRLTARPTQDLDFFTRPGAGEVPQARDEFVAAAGERGWSVDRIQDRDDLALGIVDVTALRTFFEQWVAELDAAED